MRLYGISKNGSAEAAFGQKNLQGLMYDQTYTVRATGSGGSSDPCSVHVPVSMPSYLKVFGVGQSNMHGYLDSLKPVNTSLGGFDKGQDYFEIRMTQESSTLTQDTTFIPNLARGGSALLWENEGNRVTCPYPPTKEKPNPEPECNMWVDYSGAYPKRGTLLQKAIKRLETEGATIRPVNFILWAQGEQDALKIEGRAVESDDFRAKIDSDLSRYKTALKFLITEIRAASGSIRIPFGIQALGKRVPEHTPINPHFYGLSRIQEIQKEVADEMFGIEILADTYDAPLYDTVHMSREGQELVLDRLVDNISLFLDRDDTLLGPQIESATIGLDQNSLILEVSNATNLNAGFDLQRLFTLLEYDERMIPLLKPVTVEIIDSQKIRLNYDFDLNVDYELGVAHGAIIDIGDTHVDLYQNGWYLTNQNNLPVRPTLLPLRAYGEISAINPAGTYGSHELDGHVKVLESSFNPITRNELFKINGVTYEVNNASSVGNLYLGDQVIDNLNIGDIVVRQNQVAPKNESYINKIEIYAPSNRLAIQTAKSATSHKNLVYGQKININGKTYTTLSGSGVGSIYLPPSFIDDFSLGDKVGY